MGDGGSSAALHQVIDLIMVMEILSERRLLPEDFNPTEHSLLSYLDKICILHSESRNRKAVPPCTTPSMSCGWLCAPRRDYIPSFQKTAFPLKHSLLGQQIKCFSPQGISTRLQQPGCPANQIAVSVLQNFSPPLATEAPGQEALQGSLPPSLGLFVSAARD